MLKSFKYKLLPTEEQIILLNKHFGSVRFVYNYFLNERKTEYEINKQYLNYYDNMRSLVKMKKQEEFKWLNEVNSQSFQASLKHLEGAYNSFFKKRAKFPKFKSKKSKNSFSVPTGTKIKNGRLQIFKFREGIEFIQSRKFEGKIKQCTISKTTTNEYFVSILVETTHIPLPKTGKQVGIDLGLKDFVITSDGHRYKNNRYTKKYAKKLKSAQQHLSRKKKGSNRYEKQRLKVARIHKKITNSRVDNLHKVSTDLVKKYDFIAVESLNIKEMVKNKSFSKHISDASWSTFVSFLTYKAKWNEKELIKIDRFFPSSKTCNHCNHINQSLKLDQREWNCSNCNSVLDRDLNAAKNILKEGLKVSSDKTEKVKKNSSGTDENRRRDQIRPTSVGTVAETSKAL